MAEFKQLHLLSVGIDHYAPESELPDTPFAEADARELARVFEARCGFSTTVLTGSQATCAAIQKAMHQIGQQRGTTFIFSFCGHGQDIRGQYHLHPYDSTAFGSSTVLFDSLTRQWQNGFGYQQVVSILDACRTEVAFGSRGSASFTAEAARDIEASIASGAKRVEVLYGCRQGERSWAYKEIGHGLLTAAVVDVVVNHPRGSDLDFHGMVARAADWMEESPVRRKYGEARRQTPHLYGTPSLKNRIIILPAEPREDILSTATQEREDRRQPQETVTTEKTASTEDNSAKQKAPPLYSECLKAVHADAEAYQRHLKLELDAKQFLERTAPQQWTTWQRGMGLGSGEAQWLLGACMMEGIGCAKSLEIGSTLLHNAGEAGVAAAWTRIGNQYAHGEGVTQDHTQALAWYHKAAAAGDAPAMVCIAASYQNGWGVARDAARAEEWYTKAIAGGCKRAQRQLDLLKAEQPKVETAKASAQAPIKAPTSPSPQPFTIFAQRVMDRANEEAKAYNHEYTGTEHILLGLVEKGGVGAAILKKRGISAQEIREELEKLMPRGPRMVSMGRLPYTHYAKSVLAYADDERLSRGLMLIDTEHLLLGLLHERNGAANKVLTKLGLTVEETRQAIVSERTAPAAPEAPPKSLIARRWKTIVILIMAVALIDRASLWHTGLSFFTSRTSGFTDFLIVAIIVFMFAKRSK